MLGSTVLEVAIGMVFCYGSVALIVSSLNEGLASLLRLRARALLDGIRSMLADPHFEQLAGAVYRHALINPHDQLDAGNPNRLAHKPSYIDPQNFAVALGDSIATVHGDFEQLGRDIDALPNARLRQVLGGIYRGAEGDAERFRAGVAAWFSSAMERVSGAYKRRAQLISALLALMLAIAFNIDSVHLFRTLWLHPGMAAQLGSLPQTYTPEVMSELSTLPIGWQAPPAWDLALLSACGGWLLTASSALFGAPFWFDVLQRLVQLRGTGAKPTEPGDGTAPTAASPAAKPATPAGRAQTPAATATSAKTRAQARVRTQGATKTPARARARTLPRSAATTAGEQPAAGAAAPIAPAASGAAADAQPAAPPTGPAPAARSAPEAAAKPGPRPGSGPDAGLASTSVGAPADSHYYSDGR